MYGLVERWQGRERLNCRQEIVGLMRVVVVQAKITRAPARDLRYSGFGVPRGRAVIALLRRIQAALPDANTVNQY